MFADTVQQVVRDEFENLPARNTSGLIPTDLIPSLLRRWVTYLNRVFNLTQEAQLDYFKDEIEIRETLKK